jgi:hypothetical protein
MRLRGRWDLNPTKEKAASNGGPGTVVAHDTGTLPARRRRVNSIIPAVAQALEYVRRGWHVLPLWPGSKQPMMLTNGLYDATLDEFAVRRWWGDHPEANIAIRTGRISGVLGVCPDSYKPECRWPELEREHGVINTYRDASASGGQHLLFRMPSRIKVKTQSDKSSAISGVDIRSDGSYVIMPNSVFDGGRYRNLCDAPLARLPRWLRTILLEDRRHKVSETASTPTPYKKSQSLLSTSVKSWFQAVELSLPVRPHETNDCLFRLARGLLSLEIHIGRCLSEREQAEAFDRWFERSRALGFLRQGVSYYRRKFERDLAEAKVPLGTGSILAAWSLVQSEPLPPEANLFSASEHSQRLLVSLAYQLHRQSQVTGEEWFIPCRKAGPLLVEEGVA